MKTDLTRLEEKVPSSLKTVEANGNIVVGTQVSKTDKTNSHVALNDIGKKQADGTSKRPMIRNSNQVDTAVSQATGQSRYPLINISEKVVAKLQHAQKTTAYEEKVSDITDMLGEYFCKFEFDFKKFAKINNIEFDANCIPASISTRASFERMYHVITSLLCEKRPIIYLDVEQVLSAIGEICHSNELSDEERAYKLYKKLGDIIFGKLSAVILDRYDSTAKIQKKVLELLMECNSMLKNILALPLVNDIYGQKIAYMLSNVILTMRGYERQQKGPDASKKTFDGDVDYGKKFEQVGIRIIYKNENFARDVFPAVEILNKIGMPMPFAVAEYKYQPTDGYIVQGLSDRLSCVYLNSKLFESKNKTSDKECIDPLKGRRVLYHECTHFVRRAVNAFNNDQAIACKNLRCVLAGCDDKQASKFREKPIRELSQNLRDSIKSDHLNIIIAIKRQISSYALTNNEEYIAEFSECVLSCLEQNKNPFNIIKDARLWRLYYEFGGPDYVQQINEIMQKTHDVDILSDKKYSMLSGYPGKFGINIDDINPKTVDVAGIVHVNGISAMTIDEKTILPPPPAGYCYTISGGKLKLKVDKNILPDSTDNKLYTPTFCRMTEGTLSLMKTDPQFEHHFEALIESKTTKIPRPPEKTMQDVPNGQTGNKTGTAKTNTAQKPQDAPRVQGQSNHTAQTEIGKTSSAGQIANVQLEGKTPVSIAQNKPESKTNDKSVSKTNDKPENSTKINNQPVKMSEIHASALSTIGEIGKKGLTVATGISCAVGAAGIACAAGVGCAVSAIGVACATCSTIAMIGVGVVGTTSSVLIGNVAGAAGFTIATALLTGIGVGATKICKAGASVAASVACQAGKSVVSTAYGAITAIQHQVKKLYKNQQEPAVSKTNDKPENSTKINNQPVEMSEIHASALSTIGEIGKTGLAVATGISCAVGAAGIACVAGVVCAVSVIGTASAFCTTVAAIGCGIAQIAAVAATEGVAGVAGFTIATALLTGIGVGATKICKAGASVAASVACQAGKSVVSTAYGAITAIQHQVKKLYENQQEQQYQAQRRIKRLHKNATNNSFISRFGSVVGSITKLPVTAVKWGLGWFSSPKK